MNLLYAAIILFNTFTLLMNTLTLRNLIRTNNRRFVAKDVEHLLQQLREDMP